MKKLAVAVGALGLIGGGFVAANEANALSLKAEVNPVYQQYLDDVAAGNGDDWTIIPNMFTTPETEVGGKGSGESLPVSYSLIDQGLGTTIKNQGADSDCWAYATTTAIESNLKKNFGADYEFSAKQMDYLLTNDSPYYAYMNSNWGVSRSLGEGGNFLMASLFLGGEYSPVEENVFWQKMLSNDSTLASYGSFKDYNNWKTIATFLGSSEKAYTTAMDLSLVMDADAGSGIYVTDYSAYDGDADDIGKIKEDVYNNGAVYVGTYAPGAENCWDATTNTIVDRGSSVCSSADGHAMAIVGWDDNHSYVDPADGTTKTGAFLLQNSWGDSDLLSDYGITYDALVAAGLLDESTLTDAQKTELKEAIANYDAYEYIWLAYDFEDSSTSGSINFGTIEEVSFRDEGGTYDLTDEKSRTDNDAADEIEIAYATDGLEYIDQIAVGTVLSQSFDYEMEVYVSVAGGEYEKAGSVLFSAGDSGRQSFYLDSPIAVDGEFTVKLRPVENGNLISGLGAIGEYYTATVYTSAEDTAIPNTGATAPNTGVFGSDGAGAKVAGVAALVVALTAAGLGYKAFKERKHLFRKIGFSKK